MSAEEENIPEFTELTNLSAEKFGAETLGCTDEFFAPVENLLKEGRGIFIEDKYTEQGKWMDGWESRRKRIDGHDWCIIKLGAAGIIHGVDIDTNHFLGNHPPHASLEAICLDGNATLAELTVPELTWKEIVPKADLQSGSQNFFEVRDREKYTHLRFHIYPDGGVARLKVYGEVLFDWTTQDGSLIDLASAQNGARAILCNDMFFSHMENLTMPGRGINMGDGWETKRNRTPGNTDWVIIQLATLGELSRITIDTAHFKGNYPDTCSLSGVNAEEVDDFENVDWEEIMPRQVLGPDKEHMFDSAIINNGPFTHVRLNIFPDGGISRLRLWGKPM